jgi:hypothetical protein
VDIGALDTGSPLRAVYDDRWQAPIDAVLGDLLASGASPIAIPGKGRDNPARGSFYQWVAFLRSRGSPNFLQLGDSETRTYAGSMHGGVHRSGQRMAINGQRFACIKKRKS